MSSPVAPDTEDSSTAKNALSKGLELAKGMVTQNPIARIVSNTYNFFYWLPRRNMPYDSPWVLFKNSSVEFIAWYQFPHNLPPYQYLGEGFRDDMFCYGMAGNTLPLGNWDPFGFQLVAPKILRRYRESELKHGRLAMLASTGYLVQESYHPLHSDIGGLAITHMAQLRDLSLQQGFLFSSVYKIFIEILGVDLLLLLEQRADQGGMNSMWMQLQQSTASFDYIFVVALLASFEISALRRNWTRWQPADYRHQFDADIGIGNLKEGYRNGDYNFDPLRLKPKEARELRLMEDRELNHGRLAMVAFVGMLVQEYTTGLPLLFSLSEWLFHASSSALTAHDATSLNLPGFIEERIKATFDEPLGNAITPTQQGTVTR